MSGLTGNNILGGSSGQSTGYDIDQSLRFDDGDSAYLSRTAGTATSNDIGTLSFWTKRGNLGGGNAFFSNHSDASNRTYVGFDADKIQMYGKISGSTNVELVTTQVFRDPSAWYHVVIAVDVTQSTDSNRVKIYVNGSQVTDFSTSTYPAQNTDLPLFSKTNHQVGAFFSSSVGDYYDGYFAEYQYIDGQQLTPASFAETNEDTNQWIPIEYTGSYGTNGFYLKFQDSSALGDDSSGNTNDFTVTNLTATDQVLDSPTNNFATLNPLDALGNNNTFSEGNLKCVVAAQNTNEETRSTIGVSSGKWYWEFYLVSTTTTAGYFKVGLKSPDGSNYWNVRGSDGELDHDGSTGSSSVSYTTANIVNVAVDMDSGKWWVGTNGTWVGDPSAGSGELHSGISGTVLPYILNAGSGGTHTIVSNFGQDSSFAGNKTAQGNGGVGEDFYYTPPTGYKALNTNNFDDPAIALPTNHFDTTLVSGNGSNRSITGLNFQPDFLWGKSRTNTLNHYLTDSVRGANGQVYSDAASSEGTETVIYTAFNSDGFSLGTGDMNSSGQNYAHWGWKAGGTASSNTDGAITSSVSANPTAGFSIVSYTGSGTNNTTVGHGLSQTPTLWILKNRSSNATNWETFTSVIDGSVDFLRLDTTDAKADSGRTAPTSSVFYVGSGANQGANGDNYIAYCFHSVEGYSKVGIYTGNGSADGPFIYTGFKPSFILWKSTTATENWQIQDNKINPYNVVDGKIFANLNSAEYTGSEVDFVSNGFKLRHSGGGGNGSSETLVYLAFAESPFKYSNAR
jgi:hypothetical protein